MHQRHKQTMRLALNDAIEWRMSLAASWSSDTPEHAAAKTRADEYEAMHVYMFGEPSNYQKGIEADATSPTVSIFNIARSDTDGQT